MACPLSLGGIMKKSALEEINDELLELADEIEELAEDEPSLNKELNRALEYIVRASEILEELEN